MEEFYIQREGSVDELIDLNDSEFINLTSSSFDLNLDASLYIDEKEINNYIINLFNKVNELCLNCQTITNYAKEYFEKNDNISLITQPNLLDFNFEIKNLSIQTTKLNDANYNYGTVKIENGHLNVRDESNKNSNIIGSLNKGDEVKIFEQTEDGNWYHIEYEGKEGFVFSEYIEITNNQLSNEESIEFLNNDRFDSRRINEIDN